MKQSAAFLVARSADMHPMGAAAGSSREGCCEGTVVDFRPVRESRGTVGFLVCAMSFHGCARPHAMGDWALSGRTAEPVQAW